VMFVLPDFPSLPLNWEMPDSASVDNRRPRQPATCNLQPAVCSLTADVDSAFGCDITLCLASLFVCYFTTDGDRGFPKITAANSRAPSLAAQGCKSRWRRARAVGIPCGSYG
jgi:hypothetical protein